jgi:pyridoxal phosphate enzyme (YggS family)
MDTDPASTASVADNLAAVRRAVAEAAREAGRPPEDVTVVAVSKVKPAELIRKALEAGQRVFGENRVQEAQAKWPALKGAFPDVVLHLIGPLQTNKVKDVLGLFNVIETLDRPKLAAALARHMDATGLRPDCFVQVNTGEEPQKAGVAPVEADAFIAACRDEYGLPVSGLMCIPPVDEEPALHFALLREIARRNGLSRLSMGMSADYRVAVQFGATHVRIGTAIFGERPSPRPTGG